ncbi:MAG: KH domain-containing protein [Proteobacteria bacterium]|nr:KH domain-containing protein [Pseudomonadota bacterium]MBU1058043.1 KH domain-containing protein [Pseudomonadota bacterium]
MQELITFIARSLVDNPEGVQVTVTEEDDTVVIDLAVDKDDLGKVIGKQGRTARAMRSLLAATAGKDDKKSRLNILE